MEWVPTSSTPGQNRRMTPLSATPAPPLPGARVEILEPLRGLAALAVAWFHFSNGGNLVDAGTWLQTTGAGGWRGVEVFFVISGFILPFSMHRAGYRFPTDAGRFVAKRVVRLDPPYVAGIAVVLLLWYGSALAPGFQGTAPTVTWPQLLAHLGYLNAFLGYEWLNPVFWTLAVEFQFYLLVALAYPLLAHARPAVRVAALVAFGASAFLPTGETVVFHYATLFALGAATFHLRAGLLPAWAYLAAVAMLAAVTGVLHDPATAALGAATALAVAYVRVPRLPVLGWLGTVSYSFYLLHVPIGGRVVNLGARFAESVPEQLAVLVLAVGVSLAASHVLYLFVERPSQRWSASIRYTPLPVPSPAVSA